MATLAEQEREAQLRLNALQQKLLEDFNRTTLEKTKTLKKSFEDDLGKSLERILTKQLRSLSAAGNAEGGLEGLFARALAQASTSVVRKGGIDGQNLATTVGAPLLADLVKGLFGGESVTGQTLGLSNAQNAAQSLQFLQGGNKNL
jgi:hypothetical protein